MYLLWLVVEELTLIINEKIIMVIALHLSLMRLSTQFILLEILFDVNLLSQVGFDIYTNEDIFIKKM